MSPLLTTLLAVQLSATSPSRAAPPGGAVPPTAAATHSKARDIYLDGLRLHLLEAGPADGQVVLLLHGFMVSVDTYQALISRLAQRYRVVAYDAPGHGRSARPRRRMSAHYVSAVAKKLLDRLQLDDVILLGQSMGGMTALGLAARWPERLRHVIATNPAGFWPGPWRAMGMRLLRSPGAYASGPALGYWLAAQGSTISFNPHSEADFRAQLRHRRDRGWSQSMASVYATMAEGPLDRLADRVDVPVTLVFAEQDSAYPQVYQHRAADLLSHAQVVRLPRCGHNVHHDAPGRLSLIVDAVAEGRSLPPSLPPP